MTELTPLEKELLEALEECKKSLKHAEANSTMVFDYSLLLARQAIAKARAKAKGE